MSAWTIPYVDQAPDFWEEVADRFGEQVQEVYLPLPGEVMASGRGAQPDRFLAGFLRQAPLGKAVLANPIVLSRPVHEVAPRVLDALRGLYDDYGVRSVIVANLTLARRIREALPQFQITASTLMGIATPAQALMAQDWVDVVTPDTRLTRDLAGLARLREAFRGQLRLIVNEGCLPGCPYRVQHFYEMGYGGPLPRSLCKEMLDERPWLRLTGAWVLPQHRHHYDRLCDGYKLAGRVTLRERAKYLAVLEAYLKREPLLPRDIGGGPASVLDETDMPDALFETILHCDKRCHECSACREHFERGRS